MRNMLTNYVLDSPSPLQRGWDTYIESQVIEKVLFDRIASDQTQLRKVGFFFRSKYELIKIISDQKLK